MELEDKNVQKMPWEKPQLQKIDLDKTQGGSNPWSPEGTNNGAIS